eukprot:2183648-Prymnesium_polylepis.1
MSGSLQQQLRKSRLACLATFGPLATLPGRRGYIGVVCTRSPGFQPHVVRLPQSASTQVVVVFGVLEYRLLLLIVISGCHLSV